MLYKNTPSMKYAMSVNKKQASIIDDKKHLIVNAPVDLQVNESDGGKYFGLPSFTVEKLSPKVAKKRRSIVYLLVAVVAVVLVFVVYKNLDYWQSSAAVEETTAVEEKMITVEPIIADTTKLYYIVTGSFENLYNAQKMYNSLKNTGNTPQILQKEEGVYRVILGTFETEKETNKELKSFLKNTRGIQVWVYKGKEEIQSISP